MVWLANPKTLILHHLMKRNKKPYNFFQLASAIIMMLALVWLTVSTPFVYASQQELAKQNKTANANVLGCTEEETGNSLGNATEEKTFRWQFSFRRVFA